MLYRALWRFSPSRTLHRIRTALCLEDDRNDLYFDRVDEALELIERYDPTTMDDIRRHFRGILVLGSERFRLAHWNDNARLCVITGPHLADPATTPERVALTLVHENMHARLCAAGVPYHDGRRAHVEVICAMAVLAFARRVPFDSGLVERAERQVETWAASGEEPWSTETLREATVQHLRETGAPPLFLRLVVWLSRFLRRRAA
jgi:hypothetical protein